MISDILEQKLVPGGFVPGQTLFREYFPADCAIGVMTRVPLQGLPLDPGIPDYYKGRMQVIVRHTEPDLGARMAVRVQKLLTTMTRERYPASDLRGEVHLDLFHAETLPISFPRLEGNGFEWSQHFRCAFGMKLPG